MDAITFTEEATLQRYNARSDRTIRDMGVGDTEGAIGVTRMALEPLATFIQDRRENLKSIPKKSEERELLEALEKVPTETIAYATLNAALTSIGACDDAAGTHVSIGRAVRAEAWAAGLLGEDPKLAERVARLAKQRHGNLKYRRQAARSLARRAGYRAETWSQAHTIKAGAVLCNYLLDALPDLFVLVTLNGSPSKVTVTQLALEVAESAVELDMRRCPAFFPCVEPPKPWTGYWEGGYWNAKSRFRAPVVRAYYPETRAVIKAALADGSMQPCLDALNTLQSTAWAINHRVLGVLRACVQRGVEVKGLPKADLPAPEKPDAWERMDDDAKRLWRYRASLAVQKNLSNASNRVLLIQDVKTAEHLAEHERFYTPLNLDWRGRVYSVPHFNFQRDDRVRALFLFADGEPIGDEGLYWLKVHTANCAAFDKIDKAPFDERVKWVDNHLAGIEAVAEVPLKELWWTEADKPFLFLAACMELTTALRHGPSWVTRLPVSFDGSCSGLQHLSAMTRDQDTAKLVNLIPGERPNDVYQAVADVVASRLEAIAGAADTGRGSVHAVAGTGVGTGVVEATPRTSEQDLARRALEYGVNRDLVKRNVMTYSYSSKKFGMSQQLVEDKMRPLSFDVLAGKLPTHPFASEFDYTTDKKGKRKHMGDGSAAAKFLAGITYEAIEQLVNLPAQAMAMLQKCSRAMTHEGKPVTWVTPLGLPWINRYHETVDKEIDLWMHDKRIRIRVQDGHTKTIDKEKSANGVAPNFVHACDATHLLMVARASAAEGITALATVHDSFGCLASRAGRFRQIIREQFVKLYSEHDVLAEVLEACCRDLTVHNQQRLPDAPVNGTLNLMEVLNAEFAFA